MPYRALLLGLLVCPMIDALADDFPPADELPAQAGLPDPLVMLDGRRVATPDEWRAARRPELKALFEYYMYGRAPAAPDNPRATVERSDANYFGGKATKKEVALRFGPAKTPAIHLLLVVPNHRRGPAPVFVGTNFNGNHTLVDDPTVALPTAWMPDHSPGAKDHRATDAGRGKEIAVWNLEGSIDRGYAVATFYCGDVDPDKPDFGDGVHAAYHSEPGQTAPGPHEWGTIAAWAWGISRAVDYLVTDADLDRQRIAVVGHSRLGKTALLAAALDDRIGLAIPLQAGCGGTAPSRGKVGESVAQINDRFPHWFCGEFKQFNDQVERLPFDQHSLVALVAPRPVLFANAMEDQWANPSGQFTVLQAADPVYRFLGVGGLGVEEMPEPGKLVGDRLGYFIRPGGHAMTLVDWEAFWDFADKHFGRPASPQATAR
ncbi:MAG TPA: acetylxylan esterase [Pirellulales bacterium]|nr:acetylxylan esterase [Pirellulales bacterium]